MPGQHGRGPTQQDVAALAGVSNATVSYVVSGRRNRRNPTSPEVEQRVRAAMKELGYRPVRAGQVLQSRRTRLLALATPKAFNNQWALQVIDHAQQVAEVYEYGVVILGFGDDDLSMDRTVDLVVNGVADAAVVVHANRLGPGRVQQLAESRVPVLAMGIDRPIAAVSQVVEPKEASIAAAVDHLVAKGCRSIAHHLGAAGSRHAAFDSAVARHSGVAAIPFEYQENPHSPDHSAFSVARSMLRQPNWERPDAFLVMADRPAISVMWAAIDVGRTVPDDVRVIGGGNLADAKLVSPPLTTLGLTDQAYDTALHHLFARIDDPELAAERFTEPWKLIVRGSA